MIRGLHLNALTTFERRKENGRLGWQPTLPSEPGVLHSIRRYGAIATIEQPIYLEGPYEYQRAVCGVRVKVVLPTSFGLKQPEACGRCTDLVRHERQHGLHAPTPWDGNPWWKRAEQHGSAARPVSPSSIMRRSRSDKKLPNPHVSKAQARASTANAVGGSRASDHSNHRNCNE